MCLILHVGQPFVLISTKFDIGHRQVIILPVRPHPLTLVCAHINAVCRSAYCQLCQLRPIMYNHCPSNLG